MISPKALRRLIERGELQVWSWSEVKTGNEMANVSPGSVDFSVQVTGTFGGASVYIDGSLDGKTFSDMPRSLGEVAAIKNSNVTRFYGPVAWVKPRLVGGDDTTDLTILLSAVQR